MRQNYRRMRRLQNRCRLYCFHPVTAARFATWNDLPLPQGAGPTRSPFPPRCAFLNIASPTIDDITALRSDAETRLLQRINYERADVMPYRGQGVKLARMEELLHRLGDPQRQTRIVHVAGTKGKGSVSATIASALTCAGWKTGLFTSPHLDAVEERIVVAGEACSRETFTRLVEEIWPHVLAMDEAAERQGGAGPTYFEITTAMALLHFAQSKVTRRF